MHFLKALLVGAAAFASQAVAQNTLAFTSVPSSAAVGQATVIKYTGDLNSPATITLRKGNPLNLDTIGVLTSSATGGSYTWIPDSSLASGNDYALQITQGNQINYSGQFPVTGGSASAVSSAQSMTSASASSASSASSIASLISAITANSTAAGVSLTTTTSASVAVVIANITSTASMAASSAINRNTTMSIATLTATTTAGAGAGASAGSSASSRASSAASSRASTAASSSVTVVPSNDASGLKSPLALIFGAVAAMIYLN